MYGWWFKGILSYERLLSSRARVREKETWGRVDGRAARLWPLAEALARHFLSLPRSARVQKTELDSVVKTSLTGCFLTFDPALERNPWIKAPDSCSLLHLVGVHHQASHKREMLLGVETRCRKRAANLVRKFQRKMKCQCSCILQTLNRARKVETSDRKEKSRSRRFQS